MRWETEGLQTVGIVCLVIMFLKLMHLLGLIDIAEHGETDPPPPRGAGRGGGGGTFGEGGVFLSQLWCMFVMCDLKLIRSHAQQVGKEIFF